MPAPAAPTNSRFAPICDVHPLGTLYGEGCYWFGVTLMAACNAAAGDTLLDDAIAAIRAGLTDPANPDITQLEPLCRSNLGAMMPWLWQHRTPRVWVQSAAGGFEFTGVKYFKPYNGGGGGVSSAQMTGIRQGLLLRIWQQAGLNKAPLTIDGFGFMGGPVTNDPSGGFHYLSEVAAAAQWPAPIPQALGLAGMLQIDVAAFDAEIAARGIDKTTVQLALGFDFSPTSDTTDDFLLSAAIDPPAADATSCSWPYATKPVKAYSNLCTLEPLDRTSLIDPKTLWITVPPTHSDPLEHDWQRHLPREMAGLFDLPALLADVVENFDLFGEVRASLAPAPPAADDALRTLVDAFVAALRDRAGVGLKSDPNMPPNPADPTASELDAPDGSNLVTTVLLSTPLNSTDPTKKQSILDYKLQLPGTADPDFDPQRVNRLAFYRALVAYERAGMTMTDWDALLCAQVSAIAALTANMTGDNKIASWLKQAVPSAQVLGADRDQHATAVRELARRMRAVSAALAHDQDLIPLIAAQWDAAVAVAPVDRQAAQAYLDTYRNGIIGQTLPGLRPSYRLALDNLAVAWPLIVSAPATTDERAALRGNIFKALRRYFVYRLGGAGQADPPRYVRTHSPSLNLWAPGAAIFHENPPPPPLPPPPPPLPTPATLAENFVRCVDVALRRIWPEAAPPAGPEPAANNSLAHAIPPPLVVPVALFAGDDNAPDETGTVSKTPTAADDQSHYQGYVAFMRWKAGGKTGPWRCLNMKRLWALDLPGLPPAFIDGQRVAGEDTTRIEVVGPTPISAVGGMRRSLLTYDNRPLAGKPPRTAGVTTNPVLAISRDAAFEEFTAAGFTPRGDWSILTPLGFGLEYDLALCIVGNSGALPKEVAADTLPYILGKQSDVEAKLDDPAIPVRRITYKRPFGTDKPRFDLRRYIYPPRIAPTDPLPRVPQPNPFALPKSIATIAGQLAGHARTGAGESDAPGRSSQVCLLTDDDRWRSVVFDVRPPAASYETAIRHLLGSQYRDVSNRVRWDLWKSMRLAVAKLQDSPPETDDQDDQDAPWENTIEDPAITHLVFKYRVMNLTDTGPQWIEGKTLEPVALSYKSTGTPKNDPIDLSAATAADVGAKLAANPIKVQFGLAGNDLTKAADGTIQFNVTPGAPNAIAYEFSVYPALTAGDFNNTFRLQDGAADVALPGFVLFPPQRIIVEAATKDMPDAKVLGSALSAEVKNRRIELSLERWPTAPAQPDIARRMRNVGEMVVKRQPYRWQGRPLTRFPFNSSAAGGSRPTPECDMLLWDAEGFADRPSLDFAQTTIRVPCYAHAPATATAAAETSRIRVATDDDGGLPTARYVRFGATASHRYAELFGKTTQPVQAVMNWKVKDQGVDTEWLRCVRPAEPSEPVARPHVSFVIPLTDTESAGDKRLSDILAVTNERWGLAGGPAEILDASVEIAQRSIPPTNYALPEFGPDPLLFALEPPYDEKDPKRIGNGLRYLPVTAIGPIGHTFDSGADAPMFVNSSFVVPAPDATEPGLDGRRWAWSMAKLRFRRMILPEGCSGYTRSLSYDADITKFANAGDPFAITCACSDIPGLSVSVPAAKLTATLNVMVTPQTGVPVAQALLNVTLTASAAAWSVARWQGDFLPSDANSTIFYGLIDQTAVPLAWNGDALAEIRFAAVRQRTASPPGDDVPYDLWEIGAYVCGGGYGWIRVGGASFRVAISAGVPRFNLAPPSGATIYVSPLHVSEYTPGYWTQFLPAAQYSEIGDKIDPEKYHVLTDGDELAVQGDENPLPWLAPPADISQHTTPPNLFNLLLVTRKVINNLGGESEAFVGLYSARAQTDRTISFDVLDSTQAIPLSGAMRARVLLVQWNPGKKKDLLKKIADKTDVWQLFFANSDTDTRNAQDSICRILKVYPPIDSKKKSGAD